MFTSSLCIMPSTPLPRHEQKASAVANSTVIKSSQSNSPGNRPPMASNKSRCVSKDFGLGKGRHLASINSWKPFAAQCVQCHGLSQGRSTGMET